MSSSCHLINQNGWNNLIQAPVADCEFNHDGPAKQGMVVGGDDNSGK